MASRYICAVCGGGLSSAYSSSMVPTREGFTFHVKCNTCGRRFTIFTDSEMREIRRRETQKRKPPADPNWRKRTHSRASICWDCRKACGGPNGCSWFNGFKPVPGWEAISNTIQYKGVHKGRPAYTVIKCPEFVADKRKAGA